MRIIRVRQNRGSAVVSVVGKIKLVKAQRQKQSEQWKSAFTHYLLAHVR